MGRLKPCENCVKPIRTDEDCKAAEKEIGRLWNAEQGTLEYDKLEVLVVLVMAYEEEHHPMPKPNAWEAFKYRIQSQGWKSLFRRKGH